MGFYRYPAKQTAIPVPTVGHIAGEQDGIVTIDNVPGRADVRLFRRADSAYLARVISRGDGTYGFKGAVVGVEHDVVARDLSGVWEDVIVGRVLPFIPVQISGDAPPFEIGAPYSYSYSVSGGEPPYTFALTGALPNGLALSPTGATATISGTALPDAGPSTFTVTVTDVRGAYASVEDFMRVGRRYWRILIGANNGYNYVNLVEMKINGAQPSGGSPIYSTQYDSGSWAADKAFDNVVTGDFGWCSAAGDIVGAYLGYAFPSPVSVNSIAIVGRTSFAGLTGMPKDFKIQSSADGVAWDDEWTVSGQTGWTANQVRVFNRP